MAAKGQNGQRAAGPEASAEILAEARRIVTADDRSALVPTASLAELAEVLADTFDESYTAERVLSLLAPAHRRSLCRSLTGRFAEPDESGGAEVWLPADLLDRLRTIADTPLDAIRTLLDSGRGLPEPGSEEHCRNRRCAPRILLSDPGGWQCGTCGLSGRTDLAPNSIVAQRLADQRSRITDLHALTAGLYEGWGAGERFTAADAAAQRPLGNRTDRDRLKAMLADLVQEGLIEEAPGPRGGAGYRVLEEPPDWIADTMEERRHQREAEARAREERASQLRRVLENGLTHTTLSGELVEIAQNDRGLELRFPSIPSWELREEMKRQGQCRWDGRRRRWCRLSPVTSVEPWLAAALDAGATVAPLGTADPDAEDWGYEDWDD
ncbi:hypothetical protein FZ983_18690 [Azospirillum sp. B21]|uniref:hypothetical protein n=1 Tax=Azospirillum sp. B21 TaxID=2607496 RepID=UPI0011ECED25|nr:hypothetical protein [Azospirillum sp. B21]KAA0578440.1 hypothetical protein FZ983_18690 [Azospirillum sp. B21]